MESINWLEGNIKEVARAYHELLGVCNITYDKTPSRVVFYSDGYFLASHSYHLTNNL